MKKLFLKLLLILITLSLGAKAQVPSEVYEELKKKDINTKTELNTELAKRGMTENDIRKMAKLRGLDYDEFVQNYFGIEVAENFNSNLLAEDTIISKLNYDLFQEEVEVFADSLIKTDSLSSLPYFGYEIFENNPFANKDYLVGNIDENYILAPGDEIRIYVWGSHAYQAQVTIDLNGNIALPENGVYFASGNTFKSLKKKLKQYLGKSFSGLNSTPQTSFIDVSLTQLRPLSVTVLGESNTPGPHLINGFATVLNAIYSSGGIKTSGSLRDIKVYRNNKLIKTIDLYNYITNGALDKDIRLTNNDLIFIPTRTSSIRLTGATKKEGIFELKDGEGLNELINYAGGLPPNASAKNVSIHRITPIENRLEDEKYNKSLNSINWGELKRQNKNYELFDGDRIIIHDILEKTLNQATIVGSVNRAGKYSISEYPDLKSFILSAAEGVLPRTYMDKVDLHRTDSIGRRSFESYPLKEILSGVENIKLSVDDSIVVYNLNEVAGDESWVELYSFSTDTSNRDSIQVPWSENLHLYDLVFSFTPSEDPRFKRLILDSRIDIKRYMPESGIYTILTYNTNRLKSAQEKVPLEPWDKVYLYSKDVNIVVNPKVFIKGYVKNPGEYELTKNMTVEDLILQSGGFKEFADQERAVVNSPNYNVNNGQLSIYNEVMLDDAYLTGKNVLNLDSTYLLKHLDIVNIRQIPGYEVSKSITISGEVRYPGVVTLTNKNQSLKEVLKIAGGQTPHAFLDASYIERDDRRFILDLKSALKDNLSFLKDGDKIVIGSKSGSVLTQGAFMNEGLFVWEKQSRVKSYTKRSGGYDGKIASVVLELPNGTTKRKRWLNNPKVLPNSKIYAYAKPEKEKKDSSEVLEKFTNILGVITGTLTTLILTKSL